MGGWYWLSTPRMTVAVRLNDSNVIVEAPPIVRKFIGQPSTNLGRWMRKQGHLRGEWIA